MQFIEVDYVFVGLLVEFSLLCFKRRVRDFVLHGCSDDLTIVKLC